MVFGVLIYATCVGVNLTGDIVKAVENAIDCVSCHALLVPIQFLAYFGDDLFSRTLIALCQIAKVRKWFCRIEVHVYMDVVQAADPDVCEGLISQQGPILAHDLRSISIGGQTATKLCDVVFGLCKPPPVNPYIVEFPRAVPENPTVFRSTGRKPFQVTHFSDAHIDRQYTVRTVFCFT